MFLWSHFHLTGTMGWSPISKAWTFGWSRSLWLAIAWRNCCNSLTSSRSIRSGGKSGWGCLLALRQPWTTFTIGFIAYFDNCSFIVLYIFTHQKLFYARIIFSLLSRHPQETCSRRPDSLQRDGLPAWRLEASQDHRLWPSRGWLSMITCS